MSGYVWAQASKASYSVSNSCTQLCAIVPTAGTLIAKEQNEDGNESDYDLENSPWTNKDVKVATLNVDAKDTKEVRDDYPTDATPTIMIFKDGKEIATLVGAVYKDTIMSELE